MSEASQMFKPFSSHISYIRFTIASFNFIIVLLSRESFTEFHNYYRIVSKKSLVEFHDIDVFVL